MILLYIYFLWCYEAMFIEKIKSLGFALLSKLFSKKNYNVFLIAS